MASHLPEKEINGLKHAFDLFDKNGDGAITSKELGAVMRTLGRHVAPAELRDLLRAIDSDGNGTIEFAEFVRMMTVPQLETSREEEYRTAFQVFDKDGDGFISLFELRDVMLGLGEKLTDVELQAMVKEADLNGDGMINFEEFVVMMETVERT